MERMLADKAVSGNKDMISHLGRFLTIGDTVAMRNASKRMTADVDAAIDIKRKLLGTVIGPENVDEFIGKCVVKYFGVSKSNNFPWIDIKCIEGNKNERLDTRSRMKSLSFRHGCVKSAPHNPNSVVVLGDKGSNYIYHMNHSGEVYSILYDNKSDGEEVFRSVDDFMKEMGAFPKSICVQPFTSFSPLLFTLNPRSNAVEEMIRLTSFVFRWSSSMTFDRYINEHEAAFLAEVADITDTEMIVRKWNAIACDAARAAGMKTEGPIVTSTWAEMSGYTPGKESANVWFKV